MIYDPRRRALELRQRILESMSGEELEEYAKVHLSEGAKPTLGSLAVEALEEAVAFQKGEDTGATVRTVTPGKRGGTRGKN